MRTVAVRFILVASVVAATAVGWSAAGDSVFRLGGGFVAPIDEDGVSETFRGSPLSNRQELIFDTSLELDENAMVTASYERRVNDTIGLELQVGQSSNGFDISVLETLFDFQSMTVLSSDVVDEIRSDSKITSTTLTLNVYVDNRENLDVFFGASVAEIHYGEVVLPVLSGGPGVDGGVPPPFGSGIAQMTRIEFADDFAFGVVAGFELFLGDRWRFRSLLRYLNSEAKFNTTVEGAPVEVSMDVNPVSTEFTFGVKF